MKRADFHKIEVGDYVQITQHGQNKGKIGIVAKKQGGSLYGGSIYLKPYNCEFGFSNKTDWRQKNALKDELYEFNHGSIGYLGKTPDIPAKSNKTFYIGVMFSQQSIEWSTANFTDEELKIIDKFLKELDKHASGVTIDAIAIVDNDG
jgi:hypothetical protein